MFFSLQTSYVGAQKRRTAQNLKSSFKDDTYSYLNTPSTNKSIIELLLFSSFCIQNVTSNDLYVGKLIDRYKFVLMNWEHRYEINILPFQMHKQGKVLIFKPKESQQSKEPTIKN